MVRIVINIDRLVLEGFNYHDHLRISRAMEHELSRLVRENGLAQGTYDLPVVDAGAFSVQPGGTPRSIGIQTARSIYGSLGRKNG